MNTKLIEAACQLRDLLVERQLKIVLAESCTGGWLAASLACLPGISQWWCGSQVVYRGDSKHRWLGIATELLDDPTIGPVSGLVTRQLAESVLKCTQEAGVAVAVTGDLGPGVAADKDGIVFCAVAIGHQPTALSQTRLNSPAPRDGSDVAARMNRLQEASQWVINRAIMQLRTVTPHGHADE